MSIKMNKLRLFNDCSPYESDAPVTAARNVVGLFYFNLVLNRFYVAYLLISSEMVLQRSFIKEAVHRWQNGYNKQYVLLYSIPKGSPRVEATPADLKSHSIHTYRHQQLNKPNICTVVIVRRTNSKSIHFICFPSRSL